MGNRSGKKVKRKRKQLREHMRNIRVPKRQVLTGLAFASNMEPLHNDMKRPAPAPVTVLPSEADGISPSNTTCLVWEPNSNEFSTNVERGATIVDVLNADCWRLVLDYVPVNDVVRSERVSRAWQRVVRDYLAGVHNFQILDSYVGGSGTCWNSEVPRKKKYRIIHLSKKELFENMIQKMGIFFVSTFALLIDMERMEAIAANCPNLNSLKIMFSFVKSPTQNLQLGLLKKCKQLKQLSLHLLGQGDDSSLNEVVTIETLEELVIVKSPLLSGSFLTNLRTNLKTLIFFGCPSSVIEHMRSVADRLSKLRRLELSGNSSKSLQNAHLLLDETPNLERLCLEYISAKHWRSIPLINLSTELATAIGRLSRLRELRLWENKAVTDEWMEIVARGCPALRTVDVGRTGVSSRGLLALCRARPALAELVVCTPFLTDADLEACARSCRGLELLDVSYCHRLTPSLPARLAWPRARPLRLRMYQSCQIWLKKTEVHYDGITLLWDEPDHNAWPD